MKYIKTLLCTCLLSTLAHADGGFEAAVSGAKIGDLSESYGGYLGYNINNKLRLRVGYSEFDYANQRVLGTIRFAEELEEQSISANIDWFPFQKVGFYTTLGAIQSDGDYQLSGAATASTNYVLNGTLYSGAQVGNISGTIANNDVVPYVGIGLRHFFWNKSKSGAFVQLEAGSVFNLDPTLSLTAENPSNLANLQTDIQATADAEASKIEDHYEIYSVSVGYKF